MDYLSDGAVLLRLKLPQAQPYSEGRWVESHEYFTIPKHQACRGSIT